MFALFDRLMARVRRHYPPARLLYTALLIGIGSLKKLGWEAWALELLTLPLNLLFRPPGCWSISRTGGYIGHRAGPIRASMFPPG